VADFVGMKNIFPAVFNGARATVGRLPIELPRPIPEASGYLALRPEDIVISMKPLESSIRNSFAGAVSSIVDQGFLYEVHVRVQDTVFKALITKGSAVDLGLDIGTGVQVSFKSSAVHIF
jgi:molybdate/tungstate transport system ATP-binding protein